jgi:hypothetical protein
LRDELYFCLTLTENEHYIVEDLIQKQCDKEGLKLQYYRKLKDGHVPTYREVKITGDPGAIGRLKTWMVDGKHDLSIEKNPHKVKP